METTTPNYGLRKQDGAEFYTEQINSDNMDIIDDELKKSEDHIADTTIHITATERTNYITNFTSSVRATVITGLNTATNAVISATDTVLSALGKLQKQITDHKADVSNPHSVTKSQVGLGNVDNLSVSTYLTNLDKKEILNTVTLTAAGWSGTAPYTQTATVAGITAGRLPDKIIPQYSATPATAVTQKEAYGMISYYDTGAGTITFTCLEDKPVTDIPLLIVGV